MGFSDFKKIGEILSAKQSVRSPAYAWQELALTIISELNVPPFKKSAVFKICKDYPKPFIERCLNDTKELAKGQRWKYFFKLISPKKLG
ncbi:TPA: hypothetical protein DCL28_03015 [Candidatus Komeilibacteria bacterium]|nr:MAG: hypothetical protein UW91_C0001G0054 [Parcubacteria group bacterium GW2011_GWF2_45_11]KKT97699.1 MAG: hypothetical protein UW98_C0014G0001 [Parcubacteria group bacterium GW2011_GWC2_45_15]OGY92313.1 MAG: hypothetical protein A2260_00775 [Candidatus Komeilibacteria bacterium RIFOXYA2_FULL_45_9]OGY95017.1 MAG: hypothetical protein A3J95_03805 [Candidatus Komeilibacteria bacterium RIFOXYC2_FULL_45_12]HAH04502.1 hypothetical protein [Candidatus Komeilibacteria bacterium]